MSFATAYGTKKHNKKMAKGGDVKGVNQQHPNRGEGTSDAGHYAKYKTSGDDGSKAWTNSKAKEEHHKVLGEMRSMKKPNLMAEGGEIEDDMHGEQSDADMLDMVGRIISKHMFSKGGQVANDVGVSEADEKPAEYDDLVLRDDDMEDADYSGESAGDEDDDGGIIKKILSKRKK